MENENSLSRNGISETLASLIRKWLAILGEAYQYEVSPQLPSVWMIAFKDQEDLTRVEATFDKFLRTWRKDYGRKFPAPADVLALLDIAEEKQIENDAEDKWHELLHRIEAHYHPDIGWKGPPLPDRMDHAARAANGIHYLSQCAESDLVWAKKRFVECYLRDEKLEEYAPLLPEMREVAKLLGDMKQVSNSESEPSDKELSERWEKQKSRLKQETESRK